VSLSENLRNSSSDYCWAQATFPIKSGDKLQFTVEE
jgi:hypothetical protein